MFGSGLGGCYPLRNSKRNYSRTHTPDNLPRSQSFSMLDPIPEHLIQAILDGLTTRRLTREETEAYEAARAKEKKKRAEERKLQEAVMTAQRQMQVAEQRSKETSRHYNVMMGALSGARKATRPWGIWDEEAIAAGETLAKRSKDAHKLAKEAFNQAKIRYKDAMAAREAGPSD